MHDPPTELEIRSLVRDAADRCRAAAPTSVMSRAIAAVAPGRINLIGEHVDHQDGLVLPMAIDRWTAVAVCTRDDGCLVVDSTDLGRFATTWMARGAGRAQPRSAEVLAVDPSVPTWGRLVVGAAERAGGGASAGGLTIGIASSIPVGGGLSSSAATGVATAAAVRALDGEHPATAGDGVGVGGGDRDGVNDSNRRAADRAWAHAAAAHALAAEREAAGVPCGIMDQLAVALGRADHAMRLDCRDGSVEWLPWPAGDRGILLVDSGVRHDLADGSYRALLERFRAASDALGVATGRDLADRHPRADPTWPDAAQHIVEEIARVQSMVELLRSGRVADIGPHLDASHASLRDRLGVSPPDVESLRATIRDVLGPSTVDGCRLVGAGFGGWVLVVGPRSSLAAGAGDVVAAHAARTGRRGTATMVQPVDGVTLRDIGPGEPWGPGWARVV